MDTIPQDTQGVKTYYLYIKTHNQTGLKYLGYTTAKDPHEYQGSGTYWQLHLAKHGIDYTTDILITTESMEEIRDQGKYYSELWQVVESDKWANLKPETGDGGFSLESLTKAKTPESTAKRLKTHKEKYGTFSNHTPESIAKQLETKRKNGTLNTRTPESIAKMLDTKRKKGNINSTTPESIAKQLETKRKNGTLNSNTPESIAKKMETKRKNGTISSVSPESNKKRSIAMTGRKKSPESIAKRTETRQRNQELKKQTLLNQIGVEI